MKTIIFLTTLLMFAGCKKESTSAVPLNEQPANTVILAADKGTFVNGPYGVVSGEVNIYNNGPNYQLSLANFNSSNGPDLKVYISDELQPINFINLGSLKATSGNQLYEIPAGAKISDYKYVLIYCQQFRHLFGSAELNK